MSVVLKAMSLEDLVALARAKDIHIEVTASAALLSLVCVSSLRV